MTSRDFCYWIQGFFELTEDSQTNNSLTAAQTIKIKNHLAMVFKHEIDPSFGGPKVQEELHKIHEGSQTTTPLSTFQSMLNC